MPYLTDDQQSYTTYLLLNFLLLTCSGFFYISFKLELHGNRKNIKYRLLFIL